jgi:hypothetical protein
MQFNMRERTTKREVSIDVAVATLLCHATAPPLRCNFSYEADKICDEKIALSALIHCRHLIFIKSNQLLLITFSARSYVYHCLIFGRNNRRRIWFNILSIHTLCYPG